MRQYLNEPHKLFRRVRDEKGVLRLSKSAQAYNPGRGVYRSSYKNALRLTATENNMAYRTSDYERWQQLDLVIGIEIMLSNNHPVEDVCDEFCGVYPKKFKFVGWHPFCRCIAVAKLADEDEFIARAKARINGDEDVPEGGYSGEVTEMPQAFTDWMQANEGRLETANTVPYFVRDNAQMIAATKAPKQPQEMLDLIGHMKVYGHLDGVASGMTDNSIYKKWNALSDAQRLHVLEQGRYTGMLTTEDDLDFCNLYRPTSRQHMVDAVQDVLENLSYGADVEDMNHYIIKLKGQKKLIYSNELTKPLTAKQLEKLEYISANNGMSNYRYWAVDDKAKQQLMLEMGFVEYRNGRPVASWNGKDFSGKPIEQIDTDGMLYREYRRKTMGVQASPEAIKIAMGNATTKLTGWYKDANTPLERLASGVKWAVVDGAGTSGYSPMSDTILLFRDKESYYSRYQQKCLPTHESMHRITIKHNLYDNAEVMKVMQQMSENLEQVTEENRSVGALLNKRLKQRSDEITLELDSQKLSYKERAKLWYERVAINKVADTLCSLNTEWGWGHRTAYYGKPHNQQAEFLAHCAETYCHGNSVLEEYLPQEFESMKNLIEKLLKIIQ